jgi:hypothetical protein
LVYSKGTLVAYMDSNDVKFSIAEIAQDHNYDDSEAVVNIYEIVNEDKLEFKLLDPKTRHGKVRDSRIIGAVTFKIETKKQKTDGTRALSKKELNVILKKLNQMPEPSDSESDVEEEEEPEKSPPKAKKSRKKSGKRKRTDVNSDEEEEVVDTRTNKRDTSKASKTSKTDSEVTKSVKKPRAKSVKKPTVYKKGKWNPDMEIETQDFELEYETNDVWTCCCLRCSSRNPIRAALTKDHQLMRNCMKDTENVKNLCAHLGPHDSRTAF